MPWAAATQIQFRKIRPFWPEW